MAGLGSVSIVAILAFLFGKAWSSSEAVFLKRQDAYERFLSNCPHATEVRVRGIGIIDTEVLETLRKCSASVILYSSPNVDRAIEEYLNKFGFLVSAKDWPDDEYQIHYDAANVEYAKLTSAMRRDSLGLTYFGLVHRMKLFSAGVNSHRSRKNAKVLKLAADADGEAKTSVLVDESDGV